MDINFLKNFESITKVLNNIELFKIQQENSTIIVNQSINSMIKQQNKISEIAQIQLNLLKNKGILQTVESLMNWQSNQFSKNLTQLSSMINQSFNSMNDKENTLGINTSVFEITQNLFKENELLKIGDAYKQLTERFINKDFIENLNNLSKELYVDNKLDFNIKYEDIEEINKKIEQKKAFTKKDLVKFIRFIEILWLFYSIYSALNPDNLEHIKTQQMIEKNSQLEIKTQQMIKELDNKVSKSLNQEIYYEVTKNTDVREQPNRKSKKIAGFYPKQKLLVIENKPYWLQVEYFDEKRNETIIGWVSKKCTKRLD